MGGPHFETLTTNSNRLREQALCAHLPIVDRCASLGREECVQDPSDVDVTIAFDVEDQIRRVDYLTRHTPAIRIVDEIVDHSRGAPRARDPAPGHPGAGKVTSASSMPGRQGILALCRRGEAA